MSAAGAGRALRAHVETWRPYTLWYVGLVGLAGAAVADGPHHPLLLLSAWAAPTAGWLGGHYLGDYFDRELDAGSKPHRPIPSRRLGARAALRCGWACFAVLAVLALSGGWGTTAAALAAGFGIVAYSRWCKARGIAGNLVRGALGAVALLYGALAVGTAPDRSSSVAVLLALAVAFWSHDAMSNLVGTLRDVDGDRAGGYRTLPVRRGVPFAVRTVVALYAGTLGAALTAGLLADRGDRPAYLATLLVVLLAGIAALAPLVGHRDDMPVVVALRAHSVLVVERVVLASAVVGLGLGGGVQLALALPLVGLTWWAQRAMRARHELGPPAPELVLATPHRVALEDAP
ncbi:UbiA family prenyltransferase [Micromonospora mirobrigensis]|uniref:4-hydroxybenzoate polyprenyltransferase n=1 Tax=Micromonospora mirobrigensis TaxID=262898 RepID=A0A1C4WX13_9ACTN|nr:UbiA family prenyltransferase [Micromonospora mirobrigensis]SCF00807.1 4-hydroxybenzoate polyprenyltransferase [Micromonospora mirobrigensis]